jgi:hypothetical protein
MDDDEIVHEVVEETKQYSEKDGFEPDEYERLKTAVNDDILPLIQSERSFFILGSYGDTERTRLRKVQDRLSEEGYAFLMVDTTEAWDYWTTQFKILATRATYIVGVYEHTDGGHEWEAGYLDHHEYRHKTRILKREYSTETEEHEAFDGMFAHYIQLLNRLGYVYFWADEQELFDEALEDLIADNDC